MFNRDKIKHALNDVEHRPWDLPTKSWGYYQEWRNVLFLHWEVPVEKLRLFVPAELEIDLFDDKAWVSVVCFSMRNVRPRNFPSISAVSNFEEINIRTYVKQEGKAGVYFLSIDVDKLLPSVLAKTLSGTPYRKANIVYDVNSFSFQNMQEEASLQVNFAVGESISVGTEDLWLTERYALFQDVGRNIHYFDVHHKPWPLKQIELTMLQYRFTAFHDLIKGKPDKVHYSEGVETLAWSAKKAGKKKP